VTSLFLELFFLSISNFNL